MNTHGDLGEANVCLLQLIIGSLKHGSVLVDVGVRAGVSSELMLERAAELGHGVIGIDVERCPPHLEMHPQYSFYQQDSVTALLRDMPERIDLAFIDTWHIREQVLCELHALWSKLAVGGWVVFHDTAWPEWKHDLYLDTIWERPEAGVSEFFGIPLPLQTGVYGSVQMLHSTEGFGMTFVKKLTDESPGGNYLARWSDIVSSRNALCRAFAPAGINWEEL